MPWVNDGLSEVETGVIEQLLYMGVDDIGDLTAVLDLDWLHESPETADLLALRALKRLGRTGSLSPLLAHTSVQDGIDGEEAVLVAAAGTMRETDEIGRLLDPDYASVETVAIPTERTPTLRVSVVRTETQPVTGTVALVADAVGFVENLMQRALPIDHVIVVLHEKATVQDYAGTNFGFAISYLPHYEQAKNTPSWQAFQAGIAHEVAHYYWGGAADWVDEGMASAIEYMYGNARGVGPAWTINRRRNCEAHDLRMLSETDPGRSDLQQFGCNYYLGQQLFLELRDSLSDDAEFGQKVDELYLLTRSPGDASGIDLVRRAFQEQADIVENHWSGALNAPENRPDEGIERFSHDLIEWEMPPTYDGSIVSFRGALMADAQLSRSKLYRAREGGYANFTLIATTERDYLGSILPRLGDDWTWNLDDPGDTVATVYRLEGRKFRVEFRFPEALEGEPSDYVVIVWEFRDFSRTPTINTSVDVLGYARIRVE